MKLTAFLLSGAIWALCNFATAVGQDASAQSAPHNQPLAGYRDYQALTEKLQQLAESPRAELSSLGTTLEGRDLWLLTVGIDPSVVKPAILVVGNVDAAHVLGSELAVRMADKLVEGAESDEAIRGLLDDYLVYFVPSPTPDATEKNFVDGQREHRGNSVKTDDDRDFTQAEDPPLDLDGNGFITMMRIEDSLGTHRIHPDDPRIMIEVDPKKNEAATHRLMMESKDSDQDGSFGEDAGDGVDFNRNFTFDYEYFGKNAGANQVSEIETRAIVDFCFDHTNIVAVLSFSHQDNLFHPWKSNSSGESGRIKTSVLSADAALMSFIGESFQKLHGGKNAPAAASVKGSFVEWAYFHYGRWSFASRGWWIPEVKQEEAKPAAAEDANKDSSPAKEPKASSEKRGATELNALRWLASQSIDGFAEWTQVEHPDFAGKVVEVGGFLPFVRTQPPEALIADLVQPHVAWLVQLGELFPRIEFREPKVKSLGSGYFEVTVDLVNTAYLPTMSEMGSVNREAFPIVVQWELPDGAELLEGERKTLVRKLDGQGGKRELTWLVRFAEMPDGLHIPLTASAPTISKTSITIEIK
jgi:hypothetical protein